MFTKSLPKIELHAHLNGSLRKLNCLGILIAPLNSILRSRTSLPIFLKSYQAFSSNSRLVVQPWKSSWSITRANGQGSRCRRARRPGCPKGSRALWMIPSGPLAWSIGSQTTRGLWLKPPGMLKGCRHIWNLDFFLLYLQLSFDFLNIEDLFMQMFICNNWIYLKGCDSRVCWGWGGLSWAQVHSEVQLSVPFFDI